MTGLEPARLATPVPKTGVSTNSTTSPIVTPVGLEPTLDSF
jgi:hypothetical protein